MIQSACIARGIAPNALTVQTGDCFRRGNDVFDGGSMVATASNVYAAYYDVTASKAAVYFASTDGDPPYSSFQPLLPDPPFDVHRFE